MIPDVRVADVIRRHAAQRPQAVALRQGERELAYGDLDERSSRLAQALLARGVRAGTRVAYLDRSAPEVVELLFAASKVGAVLVPLNWRMAPPELAAVMADAQAPLLIAGPDYRAVAEDVLERLPAGPGLLVVGDEYERWLAAHAPRDPGGRGEPGDVIVQMYTSGTTGVPKGVLTTHRNLAVTAQTSGRWAFDERSGSRTPLPRFHVGGGVAAYRGPGRRRAVARRHDAPRARLRAGGSARHPRAPARDQRGARADDAPDAHRRAGRRRPRLRRAALDRLRRRADHHAGPEGDPAHVRL